jgi:diadenosine tetraphosphate (Ap4A) HIT family hydrolase
MSYAQNEGNAVSVSGPLRRADDCIFCCLPEVRIIMDNELSFAVRDGFPVTPLHTLIIPRRHVEDYFGLTDDELLACHALIHEIRRSIHSEDPSVEGFNVGFNAGASAGQTVFHCHLHVIPRRRGDVANPRGGIRNVIPGKGNY